MRHLIILLLLFSTGIKCIASEVDTIPKEVPTGMLVFPFFLRSPETSWGFGGAAVYFFKPLKSEFPLRTSDINLVALYTLREQTVIVLGSTIYFPEEKEIFRFQTSYSKYPDKFWGLGNDSPDSAKENYSIKQFFINPQILFDVYKKLYVGINYEMQKVSDFTYTEGGVFDAQNIEGRNGGIVSGAGLFLTWDTRNNAYSPWHGVFAEANFTSFLKFLGSDFKFTSLTIDVRKFMPAGKDRVLGFQTFGKFNSGSTPVRNLAMLGGTEIMRGYYKGRYSDQDMIAFQGELRQFLFWRLGVAAFAAAGQVSSTVDHFGLDKFHYAFGGGLRIMVSKKEKLNLRVDFGYAKNSSGVYVILKEAF